MASQKALNPFYVLLMVAGTAFALTACAYGVMAVKMLEPAQVAESGQSSRFFVETMDQHGMSIMLIELAVIAISTVAAIASDGFWTKRAAASRPTLSGENRTQSPGGAADADSAVAASRREADTAQADTAKSDAAVAPLDSPATQTTSQE